eukprot:TRINITY_DN5855_c0_g1_i2.p1 TRINITY_DN5855_c0_g1~~TRINITY_DN5855_c0_g1_i2.p1  ORF type:complete len:207 (-),score=51.91 TRINITY_DN5855_c0_g1_i2:155-775(-)
MGRKKRDLGFLKPFCYYCDKSFINEIVLHVHQKSRHFTCIVCKKKFSHASVLTDHCEKVHKTKLEKVPFAAQGRDDPKVTIFGMNGVPLSIVDNRIRDKVVQMLKKEKDKDANANKPKPKKDKNRGKALPQGLQRSNKERSSNNRDRDDDRGRREGRHHHFEREDRGGREHGMEQERDNPITFDFNPPEPKSKGARNRDDRAFHFE